MKKSKPQISIFFPVFNDQNTVERMVNKCLHFGAKLKKKFEVIIINDGSPDQSGKIADKLAERHWQKVRVIHHKRNLGYGKAIESGLLNSRGELIFFTDGDDEYEIEDAYKLYRLKKYYDFVITFRYKKMYSSYRIFVSWFYNKVVKFIFRSPFRDISTGLRMIKKNVVSEILPIYSESPFVGAELTIKLMLKGFRVGEVGIQTFPRQFGKSNSISLRNIIKTICDLVKLRQIIFSDNYENPRKLKK